MHTLGACTAPATLNPRQGSMPPSDLCAAQALQSVITNKRSMRRPLVAQRREQGVISSPPSPTTPPQNWDEGHRGQATGHLTHHHRGTRELRPDPGLSGRSARVTGQRSPGAHLLGPEPRADLAQHEGLEPAAGRAEEARPRRVRPGRHARACAHVGKLWATGSRELNGPDPGYGDTVPHPACVST